MTYQSLSFRQTADLLKALGNGRIGFDHKKYSLSDLRGFIAAWIAQGSYTAEHVESLAAQVASPRVPPAPAPQPAAPTPIPPAPGHNVPSVQPVPQPAPAVAPTPWQSGPLTAPNAAVTLDELHVAAPFVPEPPAPVAQAVAPSVPHIPGEPRRVSAREVFADQPAVAAALPASLMLLHYDSPDAPAIDSLYQFSPALLRRALIAVSLDRPIPVWLAGPKGTGKTEFTRQLAARLGRAFYRVGFNRATEPAEILGDMGLRDGATVWQDGPAAQALRTPGALLLLDEISYAAQGYLASLNPVLERSGAPVRLPRTGEQLNIAAGVAVFAADNTLGHGDTSGEYTSRSTLSADTLDRFSVKLRFDYLPADAEAQLLRAIVQRDCGKMLRAAQAAAIIKVARVARTKGDAGELQGAPGLRACIAMALLMAHGEAATEAYEATVTLSAPPESHEELRSIFAAHWPAADADVNAPNFVA